MKQLIIFTIVGILGVAAFAVGSALGSASIDLGLILFPPGQPNVQPFRIMLDPTTHTVTGFPQLFGAPEIFMYDTVTGKGWKKVNALLVGVQANEGIADGAGASVTFTQYVHTGMIFTPERRNTVSSPRLPLTKKALARGSRNSVSDGNIIQGNAMVEGIPIFVSINMNVPPGSATITLQKKDGQVPITLSSPVYAECGCAPFVLGDFVYAVQPNSPVPGTFEIHKWIRFQSQSTPGIYTAPAAASNVAYPLISEVQITAGLGAQNDNDFIELYNPTSAVLDISGWKLRKASASGTTSSVAVFPATSTIPAHGFLLWANSQNGYATSVGADVASTQALGANNSVALLTQSNSIVDAFGWGLIPQTIYVEGSRFPSNLDESKSYERDVWQGIACFTPQGIGELLGNGCDTNNNSTNFDVRPVANPQNSLSTPEP